MLNKEPKWASLDKIYKTLLTKDSMSRTYDKSFRECVLETIAIIPDAYLRQLLISTHGRYDYHLAIAIKNHVFFRNSHYFLSFIIPIYSAFFTYMASNNILQSRSILGGIGLLLTIMTIVASILKPYERCIAAAQTLIDLNTWKTDFIISLGNIQPEIGEPKNSSLYDLLKRKDLEMSKIGAAMMEHLIPTSGTSTKENAEKHDATQ
jgi:hypothetical protein